MEIKCLVCGATIEFLEDEELNTLIGETHFNLREPAKITCNVCGTEFDLKTKIYPRTSITDVNYHKRKKQEAYEEKRAAMMNNKFAVIGTPKWNNGELLEKIQQKQQELRIRHEIPPLDKLSMEQLDSIQDRIETVYRQMATIEDMAGILELAKMYILDERIFREGIVRCCNCIIKKAVPHKDGIVWRCPHRTGDVKMEGYCESGVRGNEC